MKTFKRIIIWLVAIIVALIIIAFLLPKNYKVERTIYIKANNQGIYDLVANLGKWDLWEPWSNAMDSTVTYEFSGKDGQVGAIRKWNGKKLGDGQMTITAIVPGQSVNYELAFMQGRIKSQSAMILEPNGDSCKVSWTVEGNLGNNPISRYYGLFMNKMMGPDFEKGLAKLKLIAEERKSWPIVEDKMMEEKMVLLVTDSAGPKTYPQVFAKAFGEIGAFMKANNLKQNGPLFAIYKKYDTTTMFAVMDIGAPVDKPVDKVKGRVRFEKVAPLEMMVAHYFGPYDKMAKAYWVLSQSIKEAGKKEAGGSWEVYIGDPGIEKDPAKLQTDIMFPVK
jgi:effector-binding domain-containing protein